MAQHSNMAQVLIEEGVSTVIAMSYAVLAESADTFLRGFYAGFLEQGFDMDRAAFQGRRALGASDQRQAAFGLSRSIKDDFVPVIYKGYSGGSRWRSSVEGSEPDLKLSLYQPLYDITEPFTGRDIDILNLENMLFGSSIIHIYGPGGSGKTTLARHLARWWTRTHFFDYAFIISCRDFRSFDQATVYRHLATAIQGTNFENGEYANEERCRRIVHNSSSVLFLDNCETTENTIAMEDISLPVLPPAAIDDLKGFLATYCTQKRRSRIIVLARTDMMARHHTNTAAAEEVIRYYELTDAKSMDVIETAKAQIPEDINFSESEIAHLVELLQFHDNNFSVTSILAPSLIIPPQHRLSVDELDERLQHHLPGPSESAVLVQLAPNQPAYPNIFLDFTNICDQLKNNDPVTYRTMLCFALFRNCSLNFGGLGAFIVNLASWHILPSCPSADVYRLSRSRGRLAAQRQETHYADLITRYPFLTQSLRRAMKLLKAIGLVEEAIDIEPEHYYKLHPLLPYLLRAEISRLSDSQSFYRLLCDSFLDYWNFRVSVFENASEGTIPGFIINEWPNLCCAVSLCIEHSEFATQDLSILFALRHVLKTSKETPKKVESGLKLLERALTRFEEVGLSFEGHALPPNLLAKAMRLVRISKEMSASWSVLVIDGPATSLITRAYALVQNARTVYGAIDSETWCTELSLKIALLENDLVTDFTQLRHLYEDIWQAAISRDESFELATLFYEEKFYFIMTLLDHRGLMRKLSVTYDMISQKLDEILDSMRAEELETEGLELAWSMMQIKQTNLANATSIHAHSAVASEIVQRLRNVGYHFDQTDPFVAGLLAKANPERAKEILLHALHYAHLRNHPRDKRDLHQMLLGHALENNEAEDAILHFAEMTKLDRSVAASDELESRAEISGQQRHQEALGNLVIGNLLVETHRNNTRGAQRDQWRDQALKYLDRGRELALHWAFRDLQCLAWQFLGAWEFFMNNRTNYTWAHYARAAMLGDEVNLPLTEYYNKINFAKGGYLLFLTKGWRVCSDRTEISRCVADAIGWQAEELQKFMDNLSRSIWLDVTFFTEEPVRLYFQETQQHILFGHAVEDDEEPLLFWKLSQTQEWERNEETLNTALCWAAAAAGKERSREDVMNLLLEKQEDETKITEEVIKAALGNKKSGERVMALLLGRLEEAKGTKSNVEYTWIQDLQTIGYSLQEITDLLLEKERDSPWIYFEPNDFPRSEIQPGLHILRCSHHYCSYSQSWPTQDSKTLSPKHHLKACDHEDIIEMVEELCGLGGLSPRSRKMTDWIGSAEFTEQNQVVAVSYTLPTDQYHVSDLESFASRISRALEHFCSAVGIVQSNGLCCNSFTVLRLQNYNHGQPVMPTAEVTAVDFQLVLNLGEALKSAPELSTFNDLQAAATAILNLVCPTISESREGSDIQWCLHLCALAVQFLCLGFLSYTQAHIGPLQPFFLEKPLLQVKLLGLQKEKGFPYLIIELNELTCLGKMTRRPVLIFRSIEHVAQHQTSERPQYPQITQKYNILGRAEDIIDTWGPGHLIFPRKPSVPPVAIKIGDGFIFVIEHGKYHWAQEMEEMMMAGSIDLQQPLLIGVLVGVNDTCHLDETLCRSTSASALEHLGTFRSSWEKGNRGWSVAAGKYISAQFSETWNKKRGTPIKDTALANLDEDLIQYIDDYWGVQVSYCTGVSRRVLLRTLLADLLPSFSKGSGSEMNCFESKLRDETLRTTELASWLEELREDQKDLCETIFTTIRRILNTLRPTGLDPTGRYFCVAWPRKGDISRCFKFPLEGQGSWAKILEDSPDCATFAYITMNCLETDDIKCSKSPKPCHEHVYLLETAVTSTARETPSHLWTLQRGGIYFFSKMDSTIWVRAERGHAERPMSLAELTAVKSIPHSLWQRLFLSEKKKQRERIRERPIFGAQGERVLVFSL